jgi:uncharacterized protein
MPVAVLTRTIEQVFACDLVGENLSIVWHAGEPLALPVSYYTEAFKAIAALPVAGTRITHSMQSNGMLLNDAWAMFIKEQGINLGLSIDGPAFIHDAHRKTRRGTGTHALVMRGAETLRRHDIDFHAIAVITEQALDHPAAIFNFFHENGIRRVGFNIEEIEGANQSSTLRDGAIDKRIREFFHTMYELQKNSGGAVKIREFDRAYQAIAQAAPLAGGNNQVTPFSIISVDCEGNLSTFSPELLGLQSETYGDFSFGNVMTDGLARMSKDDKFKRVCKDIRAGVRLCARTCEYYAFCGGGAPSNKYFENGTFASTETMYCRYTIKTPIDIVLAELETALNIDRGHLKHVTPEASVPVS